MYRGHENVKTEEHENKDKESRKLKTVVLSLLFCWFIHVRLIPKKNKDPYYLNNWRPLSLLNADYKIATKALALRLRKVLPQGINNAQTGYIEGRFIGQNIRQISDILSFAAEQNIEGIATFLDFEKAFDSLE